MAMQPTIARQNGRGVWLYKRTLRCCISDFFSSATKTLLHWLFTDAGIRRWNASSSRIRSSRSDQLADSFMCRQSGRLYSQTPLPFWRAMAGCIAICSRAIAKPLVRFFLVLHKPMDVLFHCMIIKRLQLKRKKYFFPIQASSPQYSFHISGNRGYDSNRVRFHVYRKRMTILDSLQHPWIKVCPTTTTYEAVIKHIIILTLG